MTAVAGAPRQPATAAKVQRSDSVRQCIELGVGELDPRRREVVLEMGDRGRAGNRQHHR